MTEVAEEECGCVWGNCVDGSIECKGKSYAKSARSIADTTFLFALGQVITRMKVIARHAYKYGLGLPEESARKALRRIPWQAARHLCLYIFSVDDEGRVMEYSPKDCKSHQHSFSHSHE